MEIINDAFCKTCAGIRMYDEMNKCIICNNTISYQCTNKCSSSILQHQVEGANNNCDQNSPNLYAEGSRMRTTGCREDPPPIPHLKNNRIDNFQPDYDEESSDEYDDANRGLTEGDIHMNENNENNEDNEDIDISKYTFDDTPPPPPPPTSAKKEKCKKNNYKKKRKRCKKKRSLHTSHENNDQASKKKKKENICAGNYGVHDGHKRKRKRRYKKKRPLNISHYNNAQECKKTKNQKNSALNLSSGGNSSLSNTSLSYKDYAKNKMNEHNKANPIFISSDEDNDDDFIIINDENEHEEKQISLDDISSISDKSDSLSLCNGFGKMTIRFAENEDRQVQIVQNSSECILNKWKELGLRDETMKALELVQGLRMPKTECINLINLIRHGFKHIIGTSITYADRLMAMVVGILEIMNINEHSGNPFGKWFDSSRKLQVLLIAPRKHMALEARRMFVNIGRFYELYATCLIGGMPSYQCIRRLSCGLDIITGTPGKISDMVQRGILNEKTLSNLICFALDNADELITSQSHSHFMKIIVSAFPKKHRIRMLWTQSIMLPHGKQCAQRFIKSVDPNINNMQDERDNIDENICNNFKIIQEMVHIEKYIAIGSTKCDALSDVLRHYRGDSIVVFMNRRQSLRRIFAQFVENDNLPRPKSMFYVIDKTCKNDERKDIISNWKENGGVLFSTDLMSSGFSFDIHIVINFDVPTFNPIACYTKRCGISIYKNVFVFSLVCGKNDEDSMDRIRSYLKIKIVDYHTFSTNRRHTKSMRSQSIISDCNCNDRI